MKINNPYKITPSQIKINNRLDILSGNISSESVNVGYYDDTKIKERLSILETKVDEIENTDEGFERRLEALEGIDHSQFALKSDIVRLDGRIDEHEEIPCGLTRNQIYTIFN